MSREEIVFFRKDDKSVACNVTALMKRARRREKKKYEKTNTKEELLTNTIGKFSAFLEEILKRFNSSQGCRQTENVHFLSN